MMCGRFTATLEFSEITVRCNFENDLPKYTPRSEDCSAEVRCPILSP
jgi:hypothetical protein